ncbi:uncharacterized protein PHACADRAFT_131042 [Phanerochaete carnosa HHB-10118-sp]|uniref:Dystroglycan-type cadherin-like domain-containing protein n=1 Tax=Phanerochaete carnosa (strain HHB-10118-sp) TaxID=650164 RepID=K5VU95_PHACS|nr:uncharacterized protein PHACADRAFT_131042 [Phanerochaete carnosa HHB-10118-sp]EKM50340.1 hypothetical protein PHACADRAFT_131042 [Phanerochaete carnosa HHB-10118-sp]
MHVARLYHLFSAACVCTSVFASVVVQNSLEGQLPLIARINAPYNWTVSNNTFVSTHNATLDYSAADLPGWLAFDRTTLSFHGTPFKADEGYHTVTLTAKDPNSSDTDSSSFSLLVSSTPAPKVKHPVIEQFKLPNPSLSSVYLVSQNSALKSSVPALRIPPKWSFSIGFQYDTFTSDAVENIFYAALQQDGSPLPDWIEFNPRSITFNGVTPSERDERVPQSLALSLHGSDEEGYSGASLPFNIFVAQHELSLATSSLPTINVTAETEFSVSLNSPADFSGVLLDGQPIQPSDIIVLEVDTSYYGDWLDYDTASRTLSGTPPASVDNDEDDPVLPVTITTTVNQTLETNVSIAVVPSYFTAPLLQPVLVQNGEQLSFSLVPYFSNATGTGGHDDISLSAAFDPDNATQFLTFDPSAATVSGMVPRNFTDYSHITLTFTAYSHVTHSTSHTSLPISLTPSDYANSHNTTGTSLSAATKAKLLLGLKIAFGIIAGLVLFGLSLAAFRRFARIQDSALLGEEGQRAWTDEEKKWYGIGIDVDGKDAGTELRRVRTRLGNESPYSSGSLGTPAVMSKAEFFNRVRSAARRVSDTVRNVGSTNKRARPVIGKPTLIMADDGRLADTDDLRLVRPSQTLDPFDDINATAYAPSGTSGWTGASISIPGSPSGSTGERSIPRRRPDFGPPERSTSAMLLATPPQTYVSKTHAYAHGAPLSRSSSTDTDGSDDSARTHATEAVVQRARSVRSVRSAASVVSVQAEHGGPTPRLVPFGAARVPVPKLSQDQPIAGNGPVRTKRVASQMAKVFRSLSIEKRFSQTEGAPGDDLSVGIEYVRALGDNADELTPAGSPSPSFSVAESSHMGHGEMSRSVSAAGPVPTPRMLTRTGEPFRFRIALMLPLSHTKPLDVRPMGDKKLPKFLKVDLAAPASAGGDKRVVELSGVPAKADIGEVVIGVYERGVIECVGRVIIEVVEAGRR